MDEQTDRQRQHIQNLPEYRYSLRWLRQTNRQTERYEFTRVQVLTEVVKRNMIKRHSTWLLANVLVDEIRSQFHLHQSVRHRFTDRLETERHRQVPYGISETTENQPSQQKGIQILFPNFTSTLKKIFSLSHFFPLFLFLSLIPFLLFPPFSITPYILSLTPPYLLLFLG